MRALVLLLVTSCAAVPDVTYVADDAAITPDAEPDGANTCPSLVPPWATSCCGPIACAGAGCTATCSECQSKCSLTDLCCPTPQDHAVCKGTQSCP